MDGFTLSLLFFAGMLVLIFLRMPIGVALFLTGAVGIWVILGRPNMVMAQLKSLSYETFSSYSLSIVPLFLLMGQFATKSGMSQALFKAAADWLGHRPGGVAMASVGACAGFGAVCGSSLATASTMGQVALPEMRRYGYSGRLATGVLAAGGTLGILIPPSVILVIYAIIVEQDVGRLLLAGFLPGAFSAIIYGALIVAMALMIKNFGPPVGGYSWKERFVAIPPTLPIAQAHPPTRPSTLPTANTCRQPQSQSRRTSSVLLTRSTTTSSANASVSSTTT